MSNAVTISPGPQIVTSRSIGRERAALFRLLFTGSNIADWRRSNIVRNRSGRGHNSRARRSRAGRVKYDDTVIGVSLRAAQRLPLIVLTR